MSILRLRADAVIGYRCSDAGCTARTSVAARADAEAAERAALERQHDREREREAARAREQAARAVRVGHY